MMEKVRLAPGRYSVKKQRGKGGDSGNVLFPYDYASKRNRDQTDHIGEVWLGYGVKVMSLSSRTGWLTTPVTKIISVNKDNTEAKVKTESGSIYIIKSF